MADYLNTLSAGKHTVVMTYDSGDVEAELLITKAGDVQKNDETKNNEIKNNETKAESQIKDAQTVNVAEKTASSGTGALPATGDDAPVFLWLLLFAVSVGGLIVIIKKLMSK